MPCPSAGTGSSAAPSSAPPPHSRRALAEVPPDAGHQPQPLAQQRRQRVLVRAMLVAAGVAVRDPDAGRVEDLEEQVGGRGAGGIRHDVRRLVRGPPHGFRHRLHPGVLRVGPAGREHAAVQRLLHPHHAEAMRVEVPAEVGHDGLGRHIHGMPHLQPGPRLALHRIGRRIRMAADRGEDDHAGPGNRSAPPCSSPARPSRRCPRARRGCPRRPAHRPPPSPPAGTCFGSQPSTRILPRGVTMEASACASTKPGSSSTPPQWPEWCSPSR